MVSRVRAARREANRPVPVRPTVENPRGTPSRDAQRTIDGISNAIARLGIGTQNQSSFGTYNFNPITRLRIILDWAYRGSWIARAAVDCIAEDMTREGVDLGSELEPNAKADILAAMSDEYQLWDRLCDALKWARLYGGAGVYVMIAGQRADTPLRIETVDKGSLQNFVVLDRWMLNPSLNDLVTDPTSPDIGLPKYYDVVADAPVIARTRIHHSRFVRFEGEDIPYWQRLAENFWTLSVYEPIWDRMLAFDSTTQGIAQLVYKAHLRVMSVEGLRALLGGRDKTALEGFYAQMGMTRMYQTNEGMTVVDAKDKFEAHQYAFGGLAEIMLKFEEQVSGALKIPLVRLLGQSPAGLNSTGDSDWENYDTGIKAKQVRQLKVPLTRTIVPVIAASRGIKLPAAFTLSFRPLREITDEEKADIASKDTATVADALDRQVITSRATALKELKNRSEVTGRWTTITDEDIKEAENEPPIPREGGIGEPPGPNGEMVDDGFLPRGVRPAAGEVQAEQPRPFLPGGSSTTDRRARMRDAVATAERLSELAGFPVVVETVAGQPRWNGKLSPGHYGYFDGTLGMDGDAVDVMIGPTLVDRPDVYVIEQRDRASGDLKQHKVFAGYASAEDAAGAFKLVWPRQMGAIREIDVSDLRAWLSERLPTPARLRAVS